MHHTIFFDREKYEVRSSRSFLLFLERSLLRTPNNIINARSRRLSSISFHVRLTLARKLFFPIRFSGLDVFQVLFFVGFVFIGEIVSVCCIISMELYRLYR